MSARLVSELAALSMQGPHFAFHDNKAGLRTPESFLSKVNLSSHASEEILLSKAMASNRKAVALRHSKSTKDLYEAQQNQQEDWAPCLPPFILSVKDSGYPSCH